MATEITAQELNTELFTNEKVGEIRETVGDGMAINALSGGVDSSVVTMLGHRALGKRLRTVFVENGLMREGEAQQVVDFFEKLGVPVEVVDARKEFFAALAGIADPEEKREAITQTFLSRRIRTHRQGKRGEMPPPGDDPDRCRRDNCRDKKTTQCL